MATRARSLNITRMANETIRIYQDVERRLGSHPDNLEYVDAAVAWRIERPRLDAAFDAWHARWSEDGRWIAYV